MYTYMYTCIYNVIHMHTYIYIERERDTCIYIYISLDSPARRDGHASGHASCFDSGLPSQ